MAILHVNNSFLLGYIGGREDVTATCEWMKFGDNKSKLIDEIKYKTAASGVKLFDTA